MLTLVTALANHASAQEAQVAPPVIVASDGSTKCTPAQTVAISDATEGAAIYYTTDDSVPTTSSTLYTGPVTLTGTQTLIARAFVYGEQQSDTVAATAGKLLACDDTITISSGGLDRSFVVHVPASYAARRTSANPSPLLLDIHGYQKGETSTQVVDYQIDNSGELEMSNARGFIAIWPVSTAIKDDKGVIVHSWNGTYCCGPAKPGVNDVGFLRDVITWGELYGLIDTKRIYIAGHSNGSLMTQEMACAASDVVTAIAPAAWPINEVASDCTPTHPMPVMEVHGTADPTIDYYGNTVPPAVTTISAQDGAEVWRTINQCDTATPVELPVKWHGVTYDGPASGYPDMITHITGSHCANGVYTGLISIYNAPHMVFPYALKYDNFNVAEFFWNTIFRKK